MLVHLSFRLSTKFDVNAFGCFTFYYGHLHDSENVRKFIKIIEIPNLADLIYFRDNLLSVRYPHFMRTTSACRYIA